MLPHLDFSKSNIDFLGYRKITLVLSVILVIASVALLATRGLNFGVDFTGGTLVEVGYSEAVELDPIRDVLAEGGFAGAQVQTFGTSRDILIRLPPAEGGEGDAAALSNQVLNLLRESGPQDPDLRRVEFVGPSVGEELREQGGLAMIYALIGILIYLALRFEWRFGVGAVLALTYDVLITLGLFSLFQWEFDLGVLAAILAVIGYSLNDTIVIYDRIRENFRIQRKKGPIEIINLSVNQTLARTIVTSGSTLLVLLALLFLGGSALQNFSIALIIGVVAGTYSSTFIAALAAQMLGVDRQVLLPVKKEGAEEDPTP